MHPLNARLDVRQILSERFVGNKNLFRVARMELQFLILANNQLDALFHVFIYFISLHVSSITVIIIRRSNCINTSPGMISLCK